MKGWWRARSPRESFAAQKKALTAQAEEISHTVLELERKISGSDDNGNAVIEQFKSYAGITALTKKSPLICCTPSPSTRTGAWTFG